jgi:transcription elongation factor GreB
VSKAFTKDESGYEPLVAPRRPPLPHGIANYVTPRGLSLLRQDLERLEEERRRLESRGDEGDTRRMAAVLDARVAETRERLESAVLVAPDQAQRDEVRFGARVRVLNEDDSEHVYQIVGVDEADAKNGRIAFVAPLARALLGKHVGEIANVRTPRGEEGLEVLEIEYDGVRTTGH